MKSERKPAAGSLTPEQQKELDRIASERVCVSMPVAGVYAMQVCAVDDATDEEILYVCNRDNPSHAGYTKWNEVVRDPKKSNLGPGAAPGPCAELKGRIHFIVRCWN